MSVNCLHSQSWYCSFWNLAQTQWMTSLQSFPQACNKEEWHISVCELIPMIDTLFTCNPLEPRKWIDLLSGLSLSSPLSTSSIFSATTCQKHTLTNNKSHVRLTQCLHFTFFHLNDTTHLQKYLLSSEDAATVSLSHSSKMVLPQLLTCTQTGEGQTSLKAARIPRLCWRTGKLTADYCKLWKWKHLISSITYFSLPSHRHQRGFKSAERGHHVFCW